MLSSGVFRDKNVIMPHLRGAKQLFPSKQLFQSGECDIVLAEVSVPSTGQGIELGWADLLAIPIVCFHRQGATISDSIKCVSTSFLKYRDSEEMIANLESCLAER